MNILELTNLGFGITAFLLAAMGLSTGISRTGSNAYAFAFGLAAVSGTVAGIFSIGDVRNPQSLAAVCWLLDMAPIFGLSYLLGRKLRARRN